MKFTRLRRARILNPNFPMFETGNKMVVIQRRCEQEGFGHWDFDRLILPFDCRLLELVFTTGRSGW
jgi:hypothetical protein